MNEHFQLTERELSPKHSMVTKMTEFIKPLKWESLVVMWTRTKRIKTGIPPMKNGVEKEQCTKLVEKIYMPYLNSVWN